MRKRCVARIGPEDSPDYRSVIGPEVNDPGDGSDPTCDQPSPSTEPSCWYVKDHGGHHSWHWPADCDSWASESDWKARALAAEATLAAPMPPDPLPEPTRPEVLIDGVLYVPVSESHADYDKWMDALVTQWGGDTWREMFSDAPTYLRVVVSDGLEPDEGDTLQEFIARVIR